MTAAGRYVLGMATVAAVVAVLSLVLPAHARAGVWLALGVALVVQGPVGWWLVRALGTERFLLSWALGIAARFAAVAACGLVVAPKLGLALEPTLLALVAIMMSGVVVEAIVVWLGTEGAQVR